MVSRGAAVRWPPLNGSLALQTHPAHHQQHHRHSFPPPSTQNQQQQHHQSQQASASSPATSPGGGTNTQEEQFQVNCRFCNKAFHGRYSKYNMKRHLMIHRGEKPFLCPFCPHRANQKGNLKYHILAVHQGQPAAASHHLLKEQPSDASNL